MKDKIPLWLRILVFLFIMLWTIGICRLVKTDYVKQNIDDRTQTYVSPTGK